MGMIPKYTHVQFLKNISLGIQLNKDQKEVWLKKRKTKHNKTKQKQELNICKVESIESPRGRETKALTLGF